ncbi:MAG: enoyl-CoA hydratase-related protein [Polyangiaceae bacterium]
MSYETLLIVRSAVEGGGEIVHFVINRPEKLNALNPQVLSELSSAVDGLSAETRVVILRSTGDKAFVAGADISAMSEMSVPQAKAFTDQGHALGRKLEGLHCPVIAQVQGFALGGGCELALACDFIYASDKARFGQPEVNLGLMPGFGGTQRLSRRVGLGMARELVYTGRQIKADEALRIGLVNAVFPAEELADKVLETAKLIASKAPLAVSASKRVLERGFDADLITANELEAMAFSALFGTEDQREGTKAFVEKRTPAFRGR